VSSSYIVFTSNEPSELTHCNSEKLLAMAHLKYSSGEFLDALKILENLSHTNRTHLPTWLLLGCTCYSLGLHHMSIHCNTMILSMDPNFAEAYSNLGTTYRALARTPDPAAIQEIQASLLTTALTSPDHTVDHTPASYIQLAESCYKKAIAIRPTYWDANINLAGLLISQGKLADALAIYASVEVYLDQNRTLDHEPLKDPHMPDRERLQRVLTWNESRRMAAPRPLPISQPGSQANVNDIDDVKRIELHFAKGNLYASQGSAMDAKLEYFKALAVGRVDILEAFPVQQPSSRCCSAACSTTQQCTPHTKVGISYSTVTRTNVPRSRCHLHFSIHVLCVTCNVSYCKYLQQSWHPSHHVQNGRIDSMVQVWPAA
jgi:tetratricopeptide (TPR) repeat protein